MTSYVGEIRLFAGNFAPSGWHFCDGSLQVISDPDFNTLYNLIGTTYGGDGQSTFALPDLRSRVPIHWGTGPGLTFFQGEVGGSESVTVTTSTMPAHSHPALASGDSATSTIPTNNVPAATGTTSIYNAGIPTRALNANTIVSTGGSQPHDNIQPVLAVNYIISLFGVFPTRS